MPLTDEQVTSVMDWLGRTQPVGQKQLALSTATGGEPAGGPVTPGGGLITPTPGPPGSVRMSPGITGSGGSPILQVLKVADLVRRAAGLIPSSGTAAGTEVASQLAGAAPSVVEGTVPSAAGEIADAIAAGGDFTAAGNLGSVAEAAPAVSEGATEAGAAGLGLGQVVTGLGGAAGLGLGIKSALEAETDVGKAGGALSAAGGALMLASLIPGLQFLAPFGIAAGVAGGGTSLVGGMFEKPDVPHAVREARELGRHAQQAGGFVGEIGSAQDFDQLYKTLLAHQTGYVGGTSPQAVSISFPGAPGYLGLYQTPEPWSSERFFQEVRTRPQDLYAMVQAGVTPASLDPLNIGIANAIRAKVAELDYLAANPDGAPAEGAPPAALTMADLQAMGLPRASAAGGGPFGALGFSQDVLQAA